MSYLHSKLNPYSSWDKFKVLKTKKTSLISILEKNLLDLRKIYKISEEKEPDFVNQIEKNIAFLKLRFGDVRYAIADLLNNTNRRIEEGKYDDAVARLYRAIELIVQIKLAEEGLNDLSEKKFTIEDLKGKKLDISRYEDYADENGRLKLGLENKFKLLRDLGWEEADTVYLENKKLKNLLKKRNSSILAHGLEPVEKDTAKELFDAVKVYAKIVLLELNELMEEASFPKLRG